MSNLGKAGLILVVIYLVGFSFPLLAEPVSLPLKSPERGFVSSMPADTWEHALISGNGKYGALVMSKPLDETIILNHARLFLPLNTPLPPVDTASHLKEIRQMMAEGQYQRAADFVVELSKKEGYGGKRWTDPLVPAFDLKIGTQAKGDVKRYARSVDFATGVATVCWEDERGQFLRKLFVSRPDDVVVLSITGPGKGAVDCDLQLAQRPEKGQGGWWSEAIFKKGIKDISISADADWLTYRSSFKLTWEGSLQGYEGAARVVTKGGSRRVEGNRIVVKGADEVLVFLRIELLRDFNASKIPGLKKGLSSVKADFDALLRRHANVHGGIFSRARLDLGGGADHGLTSEELIAKSSVGNLSKALLEKEFDACRYAVISSSGELFPNLQGIWNGTWMPPWSSDFTQNGNVQSAIAANLSANMAECLEPYFRYQEALLPEYRENARRLYGTRGIHVASRTSSHGLNNHFDGIWPMTFWTGGAAWVSQFYFEYYLYTGDRAFLKKRALPFMKEAAAFYEDFLVEGPDGKLLFSPSYSPENNPKNGKSQACINATMDIAMAKELLRNCITACEVLNTDADLVAKWKQMLAKIPDYQINSDGAVKEWTTPLLEDNYAHRHVSHLYPLFVSNPPEIATNAALQAAFKKAAEFRMEIRRKDRGGEMAFGLVQLGQAVSSLHDAQMSYDTVDWLANNYLYPNFVTTHNPRSLFNTDLCGGLPAIIIKMLVDSSIGWIELLPALPKEWPTGAIEGIRCRGQVEIRSLSWRGKEITVTLRSGIKQSIQLRTPDGIRAIKVTDGRGLVVPVATGEASRIVSLPEGEDVTFVIESGRAPSKESFTSGRVPDEVRNEFNLDQFYQKYAAVAGFPILASSNVTDYAMSEAAWLIRNMMDGRDDILSVMASNRIMVAVMACDEYTTDLPQQREMQPRVYWDRRARGLGGALVSCGEENLLDYPGDVYYMESILIHEFAHAVYEQGMRILDPTFDIRLKAAYESAMKKGLWKGTYSATNPTEYWAAGTQNWFDRDRQNDALSNHVNTREEMKEYDPELSKLCLEIYGDRKWRYRKQRNRVSADMIHLDGYDSKKSPHFRWRDESVPERPLVRIQTELGDIEVELFTKQAPVTVTNFLYYVHKGLYADGSFFRTVTMSNQPDNKVKIQVVQIEANQDKEKEFLPPIPIERTRDTGLHHLDGSLSMARSGPESAQDSFSICIGDQPELDFGGKRNPDGQGFAVFGKVTKGMDLVRKIQSLPAEGQKLKPPLGIQRAIRLN